MMTTSAWSVRRVAGLILAALLLNLVLISPNHPHALNWAALTMVPLELPLILLGLVLLPATWLLSHVIRALLVIVLMVVVSLKTGDLIMRIALDLNFNPVTDWNLVWAGWLTLAAAIGTSLAALGLAALVVGVAFLGWLLWRGTGLWLAIEPGPGLKRATWVGLLAAGVLATADYGHMTGRWQLASKLPGDTFTARTAVRYVTDSINTVQGLREFRQIAAQQSTDPGPGLLAKLKGHDVLILFIESYGRSSFENPLYIDTHVSTLKAAQNKLQQKGLEMRSGWLTAPMVGGQSWLAHSSIASGLWVSDQGRYRAMLRSGRSTLFHDAKSAGFRTVALMPALRMTWPDGEYFGFDTIYQSGDLGYQGEPFNWILVPDQFALAALDRLERNNATDLFVQAALSSSHAPFVPVPDLMPWDALGDGTVFNQFALSGDSPQVVWADADRVREQFRLAVDYSLQTVFDYIALHAHSNQLVIVLGDHEPARFISGVDGFDVAVHVIGPPDLVEQINRWQFTPGLVPDPSLPAWRMSEFRQRFVDAFSDPLP
jgi:hypothetical protein